MNRFAYLHEVETVTFRPSTQRPLREAKVALAACGFARHDDVMSLDRDRPFPVWQHSSIAEIEFRLAGREVFGFARGQWDCMHVEYLFSSLPFECLTVFLNTISAVADLFHIQPEYMSETMSVPSIRDAMLRHREELLENTGEEPGSEALAIFVNSTYPRL